MSTSAAIVRPSLPAVAWLAAGMWLGVARAETWSWNGAPRQPLVAWVGLLATGAGCAWVARRHGGLALACIGAIGGLVCGSLFWHDYGRDVGTLSSAPGTAYGAEVVTDPSAGGFGARSTVLLAGRRSARVSVGWPAEGPVPEAGRLVRFFGGYRPPARDEYGRRMHQTGVCGSVSGRAVEAGGWARSARGFAAPLRAHALRQVAEVRGSGGALLAGVVLGDRSRLAGTPTESDFRTTGLTHLVAVSGSHLVVVGALFAWAMGAVGVGRRSSLLLVATVAGGYVIVSGVQPSAVRAWVMMLLATGAMASGRRTDGAASLAGAVCLALGLWPPLAFDLGFRMSVAAVAGLVLFARLARGWMGASLPSIAEKLAEPLALTFTAQAATLPLTTATFQSLSLIAPVANLFVGPMVSALLVAGLAGVAVGTIAPPLGHAVLQAAGALGVATAWVAAVLARMPYAAVPLGVAAGGVAVAALASAIILWLAWPQPSLRASRLVAAAATLVLALLALGPPGPTGPTLTVLDVGQGDAVLLRDGPHAMLIDAGPDASAMRAALARAGVRQLEALTITHLHDDHTGGAVALAGLVPVSTVLVAPGAGADAAERLAPLNCSTQEVGRGTRLRVGSWSVRVLSPSDTVDDPADNASSVVLLASCEGFSAVLTGDAEVEILEPLTKSGALGDIDVLKVGHHGSKGAVSRESLDIMRPELALISVGSANRFGHPAESTVRLLETSGTRVARTDLSGDLVVRVGRGWRFSSAR